MMWLVWILLPNSESIWCKYSFIFQILVSLHISSFTIFFFVIILFSCFLLYSCFRRFPSQFPPPQFESYPRRKVTSNQINQQKRKHQTDYENLLLLQKIQNAKPSSTIAKSFSVRRQWNENKTISCKMHFSARSKMMRLCRYILQLYICTVLWIQLLQSRIFNCSHILSINVQRKATLRFFLLVND